MSQRATKYCINFLRFWRNFVHHTDGLNLGSNFIARPTYENLTLQAHSAILLIMACAEKCPSQKCDALRQTGSDGNEDYFATMVGGRLLANNKRNITLQDGLETMADYNLIN